MRSSFTGLPMAVKTTMAGFILGAAMLVPAFAQQPPTGASGSVTITDEEKAKQGSEATPAPGAEAAKPNVNVPKQAVTSRDPFVYQLSGDSSGGKVVKKAAVVSPRQKNEKAGAEAGGKPGAPGGKAGAATPPPEPEVAPPAVTVTGIITGPQNRAILTSPNQSYIVKVGDKLGDYKVSGITAKAVLFKYKDKSFKIAMEDEFAAAAKK